MYKKAFGIIEALAPLLSGAENSGESQMRRCDMKK